MFDETFEELGTASFLNVRGFARFGGEVIELFEEIALARVEAVGAA